MATKTATTNLRTAIEADYQTTSLDPTPEFVLPPNNTASTCHRNCITDR